MAVRVGNQPAFPVRLYPPNSEYAPVEPRGLSVLVYFVASPARGTSFAFADRADWRLHEPDNNVNELQRGGGQRLFNV